MRKTATGRISNSELAGRRALRLGRETIRTLRADDLAAAVGGSSCDTTSNPTDTTTRTRNITEQH
jgi:hypothetical protein